MNTPVESKVPFLFYPTAKGCGSETVEILDDVSSAFGREQAFAALQHFFRFGLRFQLVDATSNL